MKDGQNLSIYMLHSFAPKEKAAEPGCTHIGHLECNKLKLKLKLKAGLWSKTTSHELTGFADDVNSFEDIVYSFLQDA